MLQLFVWPSLLGERFVLAVDGGWWIVWVIFLRVLIEVNIAINFFFIVFIMVVCCHSRRSGKKLTCIFNIFTIFPQ